jgi:hypothetical protein
MAEVWDGFGSDIAVVLLTAAPALTDGVWATDLSGIELEGDGYARRTIALSDFSDPTGNNPVTRSNEVPVLFGPNTSGAEWPQVSHVSLVGVQPSLLTVFSVIPLALPVVVTATGQAEIAPGDLQLVVGSA